MGWLTRTLLTTIGAKWLMGLTGLALFGFLIVHLLGNLQIFRGPEALNEYAATLQSLGPLLWVARAALLSILALHVSAAVGLWILAQRARPKRYRVRRTSATFASRTMALGGITIFVFLTFHLAHLTFGWPFAADFARLDALGRHDVHAMVVLGFRRWPVALGYIFAIGAVLLHLTHGVSSLFQTIGVHHPNIRGLCNAVGPVLGITVFLGNVAMPIAVIAGWVPLAGGAP